MYQTIPPIRTFDLNIWHGQKLSQRIFAQGCATEIQHPSSAVYGFVSLKMFIWSDLIDRYVLESISRRV